MDKLTRREQPDRSKIDMDVRFEVKHWTPARRVSRAVAAGRRQGRSFRRHRPQGAGALTPFHISPDSPRHSYPAERQTASFPHRPADICKRDLVKLRKGGNALFINSCA